jgi:hypothetical protein
MTNAPIKTSDIRQDKFALDSAIRAGWENCRRYLWPYVGICTVVFLIGSLPGLMAIYSTWVNSSPSMVALSVLMGILGAVFQQVVAMGMLNLQLRVLDGKTIETRDLFAPFNSILNYACAGLLYVLMVGAGIICFIVPGIFLAIKFQFYGYFIVEHKMGPLEALRASSAITDGAKMDLFLFNVVLSLINTAGALILFIGSFFSWIITGIASADVYRQLVRNTPSMSHLLLALPSATGEPPIVSLEATEGKVETPAQPPDNSEPHSESGTDELPPGGSMPAVP